MQIFLTIRLSEKCPLILFSVCVDHLHHQTVIDFVWQVKKCTAQYEEAVCLGSSLSGLSGRHHFKYVLRGMNYKEQDLKGWRLPAGQSVR
jgi:hypothetical protein